MKWQLLISWRNLWRNPRRTAVILVSVVVGIWMMLFMGATMWGMVRSMLDNSLANLTGHVQIHHPGYLDDPAIENRIPRAGELEDVLADNLPGGALFVARVRLNVAASNARHAGGFVLVGSDLAREMEMTFLKDAVLEGEMPGEGPENGILVGKKLLADFETKIGNKLILMAQDSTGEIASMAFRITGTFDTFLESSETGFAFAEQPVVQQFLKMGEGISEVSILLPDIEQTEPVAALLKERLDASEYAVTRWQDRTPLVTAYIRIWDYFSYLWGVVVFLAMGFGLVNTLLMAVHERIREFGLVRALGTTPLRIVTGVLLESSMLLLVGLAIGDILALLAVWWLNVQGIDLAAFSGSTEMLGMSRMVYPEIQIRDFLLFNALVFVLGILVSLYPAVKASRFTPVEAMAHFK